MSLFESSKTLEIIRSDDTKQFVEKILAERSKEFTSNLLTIVGANPELQKLNPVSLMGCAVKAAALNLPVDPLLGLAYIVGFGGSATLQIGYKGYLQLAIRSGQYKRINVTDVRCSEIVEVNNITETYTFSKIPDNKNRETIPIAGYYAFFELNNGYKKEIYWSINELQNHGRKYSKSFNSSSSPWKTNPDAMYRKTMIRQLLSKWGVLSIEMQQAYRADMGTITYDPTTLEEKVTYSKVSEDAIDVDIFEDNAEAEFKKESGE